MPKKTSKSKEQMEIEEMLGPSESESSDQEHMSQKSKTDVISAGQHVASGNHSKSSENFVNSNKSSQVHELNKSKKRGKNKSGPSKKSSISNLPSHVKISRLSLSSASSNEDDNNNQDNLIQFDVNANSSTNVDLNNNKSKNSKTIVDKTLPSNKSDIPNWFTVPGSMSWAEEAVDSNEWSKDQRNEIKNQFIPEQQFQHLFEAVQMPSRALEAINHPITKEYDNSNYFKRTAVEAFFV